MRRFKTKLGAVGIMVVVGCATLLSVFWGCDETAQELFTDEATAVVEPDMDAPVLGMPDMDSKPDSDPMPPALRAAFIRSRQAEAGPEYAVATHGKLPVVTNGRHKLRAELESDSVRILPMNKDADWSVEMRLASVERGEESDLVQRATREVEGNRVDLYASTAEITSSVSLDTAGIPRPNASLVTPKAARRPCTRTAPVSRVSCSRMVKFQSASKQSFRRETMAWPST